jgi:hypothetical protein
MKKYLIKIVTAFIIPAAMVSCSSIHKIGGIDMNGIWILNGVTFEGLPADAKFNATVFDDVSYTCFNGSTWILPNNGNGTYQIPATGDGCNGGIKNIYWSIAKGNDANYFQFKHADGVAAKTVTSGYQLQIISLTNEGMVLKAPLNFEGKTIYIDYGFAKQQ